MCVCACAYVYYMSEYLSFSRCWNEQRPGTREIPSESTLSRVHCSTGDRLPRETGANGRPEFIMLLIGNVSALIFQSVSPHCRAGTNRESRMPAALSPRTALPIARKYRTAMVGSGSVWCCCFRFFFVRFFFLSLHFRRTDATLAVDGRYRKREFQWASMMLVSMNFFWRPIVIGFGDTVLFYFSILFC